MGGLGILAVAIVALVRATSPQALETAAVAAAVDDSQKKINDAKAWAGFSTDTVHAGLGLAKEINSLIKDWKK